jgi:hypothetical protein
VGLFDGGAKGDDRIKMVVRMLGYHEDEVQSEVMRHVASELLSKAEREADRWLQNEISECLRGESARRVLGKHRA